MKLKAKGTGGRGIGRMVIISMVLLILSVVAMGISYYRAALKEAGDIKFFSSIGDQRVLAQEMAKEAELASRGKLEYFPRLQKSRDSMEKLIETQQKTVPKSVEKQMKALIVSWDALKKDVDVILQRRKVVGATRDYVLGINEQIPTLLALSDEVVASMTEKQAPADQVYIATRQLMLTQRISSNVNRVLEGGEEAVTAADRFGRDSALFGRVIEDMLRGNRRMGIRRIADPTSRTKLEEVRKLFLTVRDQVGKILTQSPEMFQVSGAADAIQGMGDQMPHKLESLRDAYQQNISARIEPWLVYLFAVLSLLSVVMLALFYLKDSKRQLSDTEEQRRVTEETNASNQEAILRLLDEMGDLADGDLTVTATVTEDITGAIADSINYAIDALRNLVSAINDTTQQVSSASQQTQATAMHLAEASDHQAQQITDASSAINEMAVSIEEVSDNASELADEAKRSVSIAEQGSLAVQSTISGMDNIREHIQETSKRIKRLGESSQEIGDIVELINDIAEQTNILALNAAIQAAMAGESGRGFAVVADEVQRLAERSADATRQIEALVKAIQSDTSEAVSSMEQSTAEVVNGATLAQGAGQALEAIEAVSQHLAELIGNISSSSRQQANAANNISDTMNVIQEITTQTSAGTNETAASIGNLSELANELRSSVAGFRLPL